MLLPADPAKGELRKLHKRKMPDSEKWPDLMPLQIGSFVEVKEKYGKLMGFVRNDVLTGCDCSI